MYRDLKLPRDVQSPCSDIARASRVALTVIRAWLGSALLIASAQRLLLGTSGAFTALALRVLIPLTQALRKAHRAFTSPPRTRRAALYICTAAQKTSMRLLGVL